VVPGVQVPVENGRAEFDLLAPYDPQDGRLPHHRRRPSAEGVIGFVPEMREMIATGLIEGVITSATATITARAIESTTTTRLRARHPPLGKQFTATARPHAAARTAFFVKGRIKGEYLLTAAPRWTRTCARARCATSARKSSTRCTAMPR
jgi:hypothetical protein